MTQANTKTEIAKQELTYSERFVAEVQRQFTAELGDTLKFTDYEKTLAQHMYVKVDAALTALEAKRTDCEQPKGLPYKWDNVNLQKLALDSVHRIGLGLDALIPNHIHPIPYYNKRAGKYDLDLRIGYIGLDYCRRKMAVEEPITVDYQLVHATDVFKPYMKSPKSQLEVESYDFEITNPFDRGDVVGGFGYIVYDDPRKNKLVLVTMRDFLKAEAGSGSDKFWGSNKWREEMMHKTMVRRVADKLPLDPQKVNAKSYAYVSEQETDDRIDREIDDNANTETIDISGKVVEGDHESKQPAQEQMDLGSTGTEGPGY